MPALPKNMRTLSVVLAVEPKEWTQIAFVGDWKGHPSGEFSLDAGDLAEMKRNFDADGRGRIVCDYEHQTIRSIFNGQPAPASGWITALELRAEGAELWARIEWTHSADTRIRGGEYSYLSPVILFDHKDKTTAENIGTFLHSVALTNSPFLDELPAVAATDIPETPMLLASLVAVLALSATATEDEVTGQVRALNDEGAKTRARLGLAPTATAAEVDEKLAAMAGQAKVGQVALDNLELADGATADQAAAALLPVMQHAGYVSLTDHQSVQTRLAEFEADQLVAQGEANGQVVPTNRAWFRQYALSDATAAKAWLTAAPKVFPGKAQPRTTPPNKDGSAGSVALTDVEADVAKQLGLSPEEYSKGREDAAV